MDLNKILLLLFSLYKNRMSGKTTVQERMYFLSDFLSKDFRFLHYYYGLFSNLVNQAIDYNCGLGFIKEDFIFFSPDLKRFDYELTEDGEKFVVYLKSNGKEEIIKQLEKFHELMVKSGDTKDDYNLLSSAAKIHYAYKNSQLSLSDTIQDIKNNLNDKYGWILKENEIIDGIDFVKKYEKHMKLDDLTARLKLTEAIKKDIKKPVSIISLANKYKQPPIVVEKIINDLIEQKYNIIFKN